MHLRQKFFGNAAIYLGANVLNAGIPFLLLPILTRVLSPADYGTVAMFAIALSVLGAFTGLSVHGAIGVRYFQLEKTELAEYVGACIGILVLSTSLLFLLVLAVGPWLETFSGVPADWLMVAVVLSGCQFLVNIRLSLWQVEGRAKRYGVFQVSHSLVNAAGSLLFVLGIGLAWQGRVLGQVIAIAVFGLLAVWLLLADGMAVRPRAWRAKAGDALRFGVPLIPHVIGGLVIATSGQFFVTNTLGVGATGLYVVAAQIGAIVGLIADAFVKSYGPWLYARLQDGSVESQNLIVGVTYSVFLFFIILSAAVSAVLYMIFPLVVGAKFMPARTLAPFFIFGNGFTGMYLAVAGFFFFTSKTKYVSIVSISSGIISIFGMWVFGSRYGITGIAFGFLFSQIVMFLMAWWMSHRVYPMPWLQLRPAWAALCAASVRKVAPAC